jgi:tRNA dimethylallyltransferase
MPPESLPTPLVLTGPTGSGKTRLAVELAARLGAEVVSMDSMALYRGMDVGTAKPDARQRQLVPHHLIDVLEPWESANVTWWLRQAQECYREITARGKIALIVGGTPLYLKALLYGLFEGPPAAPELRRRLTQEAETQGPNSLHARLAGVDAVTARRLHPNDVRRVVRALEVWELTGQPMSSWQTQWARREGSTTAFSGRVWCLDRARAELYRHIDARVHTMMTAGLVEEAEALRRLTRPLSREALQALGYKEVFDYLDGRARREATVLRIQTRTRNFAKRQLTWFRHIPECKMVPGLEAILEDLQAWKGVRSDAGV